MKLFSLHDLSSSTSDTRLIPELSNNFILDAWVVRLRFQQNAKSKKLTCGCVSRLRVWIRPMKDPFINIVAPGGQLSACSYLKRGTFTKS